MALTWDVHGVKDFENVCFVTAEADDPSHGIKAGDRITDPVTVALIWHSMSTGIGTITEANASEVYARIALVETLHGPSLWNSEGPQPIRAYDVLRHVGLKTNASYREESRTSFLKRQAASFLARSKHCFEWAANATTIS